MARNRPVGFLFVLVTCSAPHAKPVRPGHWQVIYSEDFERDVVPAATWARDSIPDDGPFADGGIFFKQRGITPPTGFRIERAFGTDGWLTAAAYARTDDVSLADFLTVVPNPAGGTNRVLRLRSRRHTDATVIAPSKPLPENYRVTVRVGFADFGDGKPGRNGYDGGELADPFAEKAKTRAEENGFYWLTILDAVPRPHNNVWIHHHRKVVIDSDNHSPPWMEIFDGKEFVESGEHPVMMFALTGKTLGTSLRQQWIGAPFISLAADEWQAPGEVRAADGYLDRQWYRVTIERVNDRFTLSVEGEFRYGHERIYKGTLDARENCIFHFNRAPERAAACVNSGSFPGLGSAHWPADTGWPDYFMFGDPHTNYYEGTVYYDDLVLSEWTESQRQ